MDVKIVPSSVTMHLTREEVGVLLAILRRVDGSPPSEALVTVHEMVNKLDALGFEMSGEVDVYGEITLEEIHAQKTKSSRSSC